MIEYYNCPVLRTCPPRRAKKDIIFPTNEEGKNENQTTPASHYTTPASLINSNKIITTPTPSPKNCPSGQYLENNDCKICPTGYYCSNNNKNYCYDYNNNTPYSASGAYSCSKNCPAGLIKYKYREGTANPVYKCNPCPLGKQVNLNYANTTYEIPRQKSELQDIQDKCQSCPSGKTGITKYVDNNYGNYSYNECS